MKFNFNQIERIYNGFIGEAVGCRGYTGYSEYIRLIPHRNHEIALSNKDSKICVGIYYNYSFDPTINNNIYTCTVQSDKYSLYLYSLSPSYYTDDVSDIIESNQIRLKRHIDYFSNMPLSIHLNKKKLSSRVNNYIRNKINSFLEKRNRTLEYSIRDIYFSYREENRDLVVVIKHKDNIGTEALYINTK